MGTLTSIHFVTHNTALWAKILRVSNSIFDLKTGSYIEHLMPTDNMVLLLHFCVLLYVLLFFS